MLNFESWIGHSEAIEMQGYVMRFTWILGNTHLIYSWNSLRCLPRSLLRQRDILLSRSTSSCELRGGPYVWLLAVVRTPRWSQHIIKLMALQLLMNRGLVKNRITSDFKSFIDKLELKTVIWNRFVFDDDLFSFKNNRTHFFLFSLCSSSKHKKQTSFYWMPRLMNGRINFLHRNTQSLTTSKTVPALLMFFMIINGKS